MRWVRGLGGLLLVVVLATGCIKFEATIVIDDDGSGSVDALSAIDAEGVVGLFGEFEMPEADFLTEETLCEDNVATSDIPVGAEVSDYNEDGFCGQRITYDLEASDDHSAAIGDLFDENPARLFKQGENWVFEADLDLSDATSDAEVLPAAMIEAMFGDASIVFVVDLPGQAIDGQNNATSVSDDGRFEWDIDLADPPARLFAQTEPGSSGGSLGWILLIVALFALLGAAAWWFLTQRKSSETALPNPTPMPGPDGQPVQTLGTTPMAAPPVADTPAVTVTPTNPTNPMAQETVAMFVSEEQAAAATAPVEQAAVDPMQPVFDETLNAWVVDDPVRGKLVHDPSTETWNPA